MVFMTLLKPTTSQLMTALPTWPMSPSAVNSTDVLQWQAKNIPWEWTPEEFEMQTRMLMMSDCYPRDMLAWLVHGVRWTTTDIPNGSLMFEDQVNLWRNKGAYFRAWVTGTNRAIPDDVVQNVCARLDWHPVWRNSSFANIVDDFVWAREIGEQPRRIAASRKSLSSFGSLELGHASQDHEFRYAAAGIIAKKMRWGQSQNGQPIAGTSEFLKSASLDALSPFFQRALLVACMQNGDAGILEEGLANKARAVWAQKLPEDEQAWWQQKSRIMVWTRENSDRLLEQGIHPLSLIYRERSQDLTLFEDLNPEAFRHGSVLRGLLVQNNDGLLPLPELDMDGPTV